jgi:hypothetical protein
VCVRPERILREIFGSTETANSDSFFVRSRTIQGYRNRIPRLTLRNRAAPTDRLPLPRSIAASTARGEGVRRRRCRIVVVVGRSDFVRSRLCALRAFVPCRTGQPTNVRRSSLRSCVRRSCVTAFGVRRFVSVSSRGGTRRRAEPSTCERNDGSGGTERPSIDDRFSGRCGLTLAAPCVPRECAGPVKVRRTPVRSRGEAAPQG